VFWSIVRKTWGFHKDTDKISLSQISEQTNIEKSNVARALRILCQRNVIEKKKGNVTEYRVQKDYTLWQEKGTVVADTVLPNTETLSQQILGSVSSDTENSISTDTHKIKKEIITKDTLQKKEIFELPVYIDESIWQQFLEMREKMKSPATKQAQKLIINKLGGFFQKGQDPNEILKQSIISNWKNVFPINGGGKYGTGKWKNTAQSTTIPDHYETPDEVFGAGYTESLGLVGKTDGERGDTG
jgi:phage replication O-like protein O